MNPAQAEVMVEECGPLVRWVIARNFRCYMRRHFDDMYAVGLVAVWQAALSYQPRGNTWASWVITKLNWSIASHLRTATGRRLRPGSIKRMVPLECLLKVDDHPSLRDERARDPARQLELEDMRARLRRRLGRDYILLEGVLEERPLTETGRLLGLSDSGACFRRQTVFAKIRAGAYGDLIEV